MTRIGPQGHRRGKKIPMDWRPSQVRSHGYRVCGYGRHQNPAQIWAVAALSFRDTKTSLSAFLDTVPSSFLSLCAAAVELFFAAAFVL